MVNIEEVSILPIPPTPDGLLAFCSFIISDGDFKLKISDVAIRSTARNSSFRLAYPERILPNGLKICCVFPVNQSSAQVIDEAVLGKFQELIRQTIEFEKRKRGEIVVGERDESKKRSS